MRIHRVSKRVAFENRLQVILGQLECTCDARVDVVTLLKVDVLKEIAAHRPGRNGVAIHLDAGELRNGTLNWHQSLAEVLVNGEFYLGCRHKNDSVRRFPVHILGSPMGTIKLYGSLGADIQRSSPVPSATWPENRTIPRCGSLIPGASSATLKRSTDGLLGSV